MSENTPFENPAVAAEGAEVAAPVQVAYKSQRGRRIMTVVLVLLVILLLLATLFLWNLARPKGNIASRSDTGGITWIRSIYGIGSEQTEQLWRPATVAIAPNGDVIVPDIGYTAVRALRFDSSGVFKEAFAGSEDVEGSEEGGLLRFPTMVEQGPDGRHYFVQNATDEILVMNERGDETEFVQRVEGPMSIAVSDDRIVIGTEQGWVLTDLEFNVLLGPFGIEGEFDKVSGVAIDDDNNIYTVDTYNNVITKWDEAGNEVWSVLAGSPANQNTEGRTKGEGVDTGAGMQIPTSAELDNAGRLVVVDPMDFSIAAFNTEDGSLAGKWGAFGTEEGKFNYPSAIAYDPVRDWFAVADTGNDRVQIIRIPGSGGGAGGALARALAGPLRACLIPLILLLLAVAGWIFWKWRERKLRLAAEKKAEELAAAAGYTVNPEAVEVLTAAADTPSEQ